MCPDHSFDATSQNGAGIAARLRVVVVDDDPDTVMTLLALLRDEGYEAEGYGGGRVALEAIAKSDPDVIVSDIGMPPPNGWDVARQVRAMKGARPRPLMIAITGQYTKSADRVLAQIAGFDYFLTKPCDPQVLMALIEKARPVKKPGT
jgi:DNA-binding response OmpR family regulator